MNELSSSSISPYYHLIFTALAFILSCLVFFLTRPTRAKRVKLPPGPPGWPVVGNLLQVARSGKPFFQYVKELLPKYGPIFTLKMGTRTMIIVCSPELAYEALIVKGQIFANRPSETSTRTVFSSHKFTVNAALHGPVWRSLRRNMVQNMLSTSRVKHFRNVRDGAMETLVSRLGLEAEMNEGVVWVRKNVRFAVFCILLSMCFGVEMDDKTIDKVDQVMKTVLITLDPRLDDFLPILSPFFSKQRKRVADVRDDQMRTLVPLIEKRRSVLKDLGSVPSAASFSYLDTLFDLRIEGRESLPSNSEMVSLCSEFLNGGTDTTATAIEWAMARIVENPDIQTTLYREIKQTVGDKKVDEKDTEKMVYLNAFVKELLRKHPPTYFVLTHAVTESTELGGYDIPVGAGVDFFSHVISEDPRIWSDPEKFDPDRFLEGKEDADITGVTGVKMLPFGAGRRICPGLGLGTIHINLMIARMVQEFEWVGYPENEKMDLSEKFEFAVVMKNPLKAKIVPRI